MLLALSHLNKTEPWTQRKMFWGATLLGGCDNGNLQGLCFVSIEEPLSGPAFHFQLGVTESLAKV